MDKHWIRKILFLSLSLMMLFFNHLQANSSVAKVQLADGLMRVKISFNYAKPPEKVIKLRGLDAYYSIMFPLPNKWEVVAARGYLKYHPSIFLIKNLSGGIVFFNNKVVRQFFIYDYNKQGVAFDIPVSLFKSHNLLTLEYIMHYTHQCEDGAHSTLFSNIDLQNSYIELIVRPKPIKEEVASIANDVFDDKQYIVTPLNFIVDDYVLDWQLRPMALMSAVAADFLKYRLEKIEVSEDFDDSMHNVLIGSKEWVRERLVRAFGKDFVFHLNPISSYLFNDRSCLASLGGVKGATIASKGSWMGKSLSLNGTHINLPTQIDKKRRDITLSFWMKSSSSKRQALFSLASQALVTYKGYVVFMNEKSDFYGAKLNITDGKWHHIAVILRESGYERSRLFVDGKEIRLRSFERRGRMRGREDFSTLTLGGVFGTREYDAKAMFDQLFIFDHTLSLQDIYAIYRTSLRRKALRLSDNVFIEDRLAHDVSIIQNPNDPSKAIILIAPKERKRIEDVVSALLKKDLSLYHRSGYDLDTIKIPKPAKPYSAKGFIKDNERIYFKDLGYKTKLLKGWYPEKIRLPFKVYPDYYFSSKESIKTSFHYVFPSVIHADSVVNIFLNGKFAKQVDILKSRDKNSLEVAASIFFDLKSLTKMPIYLLNKGKNEMVLDFSLIPMKKGHCEIYNEENLVATVMDNSYFKLPKAKRWVEMPYLEYVRDAQYPFSIYPDLQDTVVLLADRSPSTVAAALNFIFFLTEEIGSFPYYLTIADRLSEKDREKNIILFGRSYQKSIVELSQDAPVTFSKEGMRKVYPFIKRFLDHDNILKEENRKKYLYKTIMNEENFVDDNLIMQMFRSPFNDEKIVLMVTAQSGECLKNGIQSIVKFENRHLMEGDLVVYNAKIEDGVTFNVKDKYVLSQMSWFDTLALKISFHPLYYLLFALLFLAILTWILRYMLERFRKVHNGDAE